MSNLIDRKKICASTSRKLADAAPKLSQLRAMIGFDGFVDEIIAVVDKRHDNERFDRVKTIDVIGKKILAAAGQSSNYELVVKQMKLGGNGPIMANALVSAGMSVTYIGNLGVDPIHPVFKDLAVRAAKVYSIAEPGHTDALEFEDGKLMFGKLTSLTDINWQNLLQHVGREALQKLLEESQLIGMVNWTMLPHMSAIWKKMLEEMMPQRKGPRNTLFVDLADPEKRTHGDIREALQLLTKFEKFVNVTLGLNLKESGEVLEVLSLPAPPDAEAAIEKTAATIREKLGLSCVVVHPRRGAAAATADGQTTQFAGPFVKDPKISTGAGDHFNAGFSLGRSLGFELAECLCVGVGTSGYYVRSAHSPSARELAEFIANLPDPQ